jgi:HEAT repeat protein
LIFIFYLFVAVSGCGGSKTEKTVEKLLNEINNTNEPGVRTAAISALLEINPEKAVSALLYYISLDVEDWHTLFWLRDTLNKLKLEKTVVPLINALKDERSYIRERAAYVLGYIKSKKAVDPLINTLNDEYPEVRKQAAYALGEIKTGKAVELLIKAIKDEHPDVCQEAANALGKLESKKAVEPLIQALTDNHCQVRLAAEYALRKINN